MAPRRRLRRLRAPPSANADAGDSHIDRRAVLILFVARHTWFLACLDRAFDGAEDILGHVFRKARFWEKHAAGSFNERQRDMINRLLDGFEGKLTSSKWSKIEKSSADTALRDINDLIARGILLKDIGAGRSTSYSLVTN